ncbi:Hypothetical predicted protein [Lecanosticta acicola]|uniref:Uncharacterized protein n=1 Tax=Lecanosticta acicola TaxID=111012 RepID=A0AAI8Z266_9PEZI|nr:Hypothetical predicted protein [Lecanosticta acicola]
MANTRANNLPFNKSIAAGEAAQRRRGRQTPLTAVFSGQGPEFAEEMREFYGEREGEEEEEGKGENWVKRWMRKVRGTWCRWTASR